MALRSTKRAIDCSPNLLRLGRFAGSTPFIKFNRPRGLASFAFELGGHTLRSAVWSVNPIADSFILPALRMFVQEQALTAQRPSLRERGRTLSPQAGEEKREPI